MSDRRIVGFHQDAALDWVAELECGHGQHVRHDPPWQLRPWVVTEEGRQSHLGTTLDCRYCDDSADGPGADVGMRGLCPDGVDEVIGPSRKR